MLDVLAQALADIVAPLVDRVPSRQPWRALVLCLLVVGVVASVSVVAWIVVTTL